MQYLNPEVDWTNAATRDLVLADRVVRQIMRTDGFSWGWNTRVGNAVSCPLGIVPDGGLPSNLANLTYAQR